jgi:hypothetical protein
MRWVAMPEASRDRSFIRDQGARLLDRAAKAWVKVSELRRRADQSANQARGAVARRWNALRTRLAYRRMLWRACWAWIARRRGVVAEARQRLWDELRANAAVRSHLNARWAPWWLGFARRFPVHCALLAAFVVLAVPIHLALFGAEPLVCRREAGSCHEVLRSVVGVVLSAQAALLAVIFPVAVALVTLLGGNGLRRRERLQLFFADTELAIAGMSALLLAGTSTVVLTWGEHASPQLASFGASLCSVWFGLNLSGLGFFLWRGVRFLLPGGQDQALRRQVASLYWPEEAAPKLADEMLYRALRPDDAARIERMKFWQFADLDGVAKVAVNLPAPARLVEVRLEVLDAVAHAVARRGGANPPKVGFAAPHDLSIGCQCEGSVTLAKVSVPVTAIERWLIRRAYVFSTRATVSEPLTGERLLHELATDALDDLRSGNWPVLEERLGSLAALHGFLLRLASRRDADGRRHSYVTELTGWSDLSIGHSWARTHLSLFETAASRLHESRQAFRSLARLPLRIADAAGRSVPQAAFTATDALLAYLAYRLYDRGAEAAGGATALGDIAKTPMPLPDAARDWYDAAWRDLSAAWKEITPDRVPRPPANAPPERRWAACVEHTPALDEHLHNTADLVAMAAVLGDLIGGGRALDLLLRWPGELDDAEASNTAVALDLHAVSPVLLNISDWAKVERGLPRQPFADGWPVDPTAVFQAALANAWGDGCLALALTLSGWASEAGASSPAATLLASLVHRRFSDSAKGTEEGAMLLGPDPFELASLLRTVATIVAESPGSQDGRSWALEKRLRRLGELARASFVPGRVYSGPGTSDRLHDSWAQLAVCLLAVALKPGHRGPWPTAPDALGLASPSPADDRVAEFFGKVAEATGTVSDDLLRRLAPSGAATEPEIARARKRVRVHCKQITRAIRRRRSATISTAPIDPDRLAAIASAAESRAFAKETAGPLVALFAAVEHVPGEQPIPVERQITDYSRGALTRPLLEQPVSNEAEWWAETFRRQLSAEIYRHVLRRAGQRVQAHSPEAWRDTLLAGLARFGTDGTPVLLWGRDWPGRWARECELGAAILERLNHAKPREWARVRTPFLDAARIERLPRTGPTLVAPASYFRRIVFGRGADGHIVKVGFTSNPDDPAQGVLAARCTFDLELDRPDLALVIETHAQPG